MPLLTSKICAITGGTTGIGRAIALEYVRQGAKVAVNHLDNAEGAAQFKAMVAEVEDGADKLMSVAGDVSMQETSARLVGGAVERWGRLDVFVSNAGVCKFADFLTLEKDLFDSTLHTNLSGAFYSTQAAARQMSSQQPPGGSIIGISSISALVGGGLQTHYTPTKAGVLSLMQSCAVALGKYNIRCNALLPGTIKTQLNEKDLEDPEKKKYMEGRVPLGRTGVPTDLAGPAVFLACEELSGYVTGSQMLVDGGLFVNLQ